MTTNKDKDENIQVWEKPYRAKGLQERNNAFECFLKYRDAGAKRSLTELSKSEGIKYQRLCDWSYKYRWNERIDAMIQFENDEKRKINSMLKEKALESVKQRLEIKNELIEAIFNVLKDNVSKYAGTVLDFKDFVSLLNLAMKVESMNIDDMTNIHEVEQLFSEHQADAQMIQAIINNYSMVLTSENNDAIMQYQEDMKDDKY